MAKKLTPITIAAAKSRRDPQTGKLHRVEIPDGACNGLFLICQPSGHKSFAVRYRFEGRTRKLTLGDAGVESLVDARARATEALRRVAQGADPATEKQLDRKASVEAAAARKEDSVENLAEQFIERYAKAKGNRTWGRAESIFNRVIVPAWRGKTVHEIAQDDVEHLIDKIADRHPIAANRVLTTVRKWFSWMAGRYRGGKKAILRQRIRTSPCLGVEPPGREVKRDRVLSDDELKVLWAVCDEIGKAHGSFVRLLVLTGQRRNEVAGMRWSEIDLNKGTWEIPSERSKNKLAHVVPLPPQALDIIRSLPRFHASDFVITTSGQVAINGHSKVKRLIDEKMRTAKPWVFHDLRRSAATGMAKIGILPHVIEATINHTSGSAKSGVAGVYNVWSYYPEKSAALARWAGHVEQIVTGKPAKVIMLRA
jgi:integrase